MVKTILKVLRNFFIVVLCLSGVGYLYILSIGPDIDPTILEPQYPKPANQVEAFQQDLDYLKSYPDYDLSYSEKQRDAFLAIIRDSEQDLENMSKAQFDLVVSRAVAQSNNAHTNRSPGLRSKRYNRLPVRFGWFKEGLYILQARKEHQNLLGAKVLSISETAPEKLVDLVGKYYSAPRGKQKLYASLYMIESPELLKAMGVSTSDETIQLRVELSEDSKEEKITLQAIDKQMKSTLLPFEWKRYVHKPMDKEEPGWFHLMEHQVPPQYLKNPEVLYEGNFLEQENAYYLKIWACYDVTGQESLYRELLTVLDEIQGKTLDYFIIDLRHNPGGSFAKTLRFTRSIKQAIDPSTKIYMLTSAGTFSAGIITAALFKDQLGEQVIIAGEPVGDNLRFWGDGGGKFTLPNSKISLRIWRTFHDWKEGTKSKEKNFWTTYLFGVGVSSLEPDMFMPLSFEDYSQGKDSVIKAIKKLQHDEL